MDSPRTLTLTIMNAAALRGGAPEPYVVDRRDATIGRSLACDWMLPDERCYISSRHGEISYRSGDYFFTDVSMNGTFMNGSAERMTASQRLQDGDSLVIGQYEIGVALSVPAVGRSSANAPAEQSSLPQGRAAPLTTWDQITDRHKVDWLRAGFDERSAASSADNRYDTEAAPERATSAEVLAGSGRGKRAAQGMSPSRNLTGSCEQGAAILLAAAEVSRPELSGSAEDILARAGQLLRRLVSGLVVLVEARARAKAEMGAEATTLRYDGNNPVKFTHTPQQALTQLLNPAQRGFMGADRAIEDAFRDLQTHQIATLDAVEAAMRATLERFSPGEVRARAEAGSLLKRMLPAARDAALWRAYEDEYAQFAAEEAFTTLFIREFRKAYEEQSRSR